MAILAANGHEYLECYVGAPAAGFVIVPLNTRHAAPELEYAVRDSGARLLLTDRPAGTLAGCVERVVTFGEEYETLLAAAPTREPGTARSPRRISPGSFIRAARPASRKA